jgi:hypothetical protein
MGSLHDWQNVHAQTDVQVSPDMARGGRKRGSFRFPSECITFGSSGQSKALL